MNNILRIICVFALGVPVLSRGKKSINLALETSVLFEPQDSYKHLEFIRDARRFLDTLEDAIMPKKLLRDDKPKQSLTDFISRLANTILHLYEEDLETFFKVLENEMKSQFLKGSIFRDIVYDPKLQTFFRNKLKEWANTDPRQMKAKLRQYMAKDANDNDTLHELGRFLNDYYGREQEFKMDEIIKRLGRTLDESEISIIVRDALNTLVLQHYDQMNYTTRAKLVDKINTIKDEYFTSHVDHDLKLTFRRKHAQPKDSSSIENIDAWLFELERKGAADRDIFISDVEVQEPSEDKGAPVLTIDDWDNWLNNRNKKGIRKINTLMSDNVEEIIKASEQELKLKNKHKHIFKDNLDEDSTTGEPKSGNNEIDESIDEPKKVKARADLKSGSNENDESIDEHDEVKTKADIKLGKSEMDISRDEPERVKTTADFKSGSIENDESIDEPEEIKTKADFKLRNSEMEVSVDELEAVKTTTDFKSGSKENYNSIDGFEKENTSDFKFRKNVVDASIDELEKVKTTADFKLRKKENESIDELEKANNKAVIKLGNNKIDVSIDEPKQLKDIDFKSKHKRKKFKDKDKPVKIKASGDFILGGDYNKESIDKLKDTANFKLRQNRYDLTEDESETSTRNKGLTTVEVFSQLYGIKPNKELIIDKDLEIYVGGFGASLVGNKNKL